MVTLVGVAGGETVAEGRDSHWKLGVLIDRRIAAYGKCPGLEAVQEVEGFVSTSVSLGLAESPEQGVAVADVTPVVRTMVAMLVAEIDQGVHRTEVAELYWWATPAMAGSAAAEEIEDRADVLPPVVLEESDCNILALPCVDTEDIGENSMCSFESQ